MKIIHPVPKSFTTTNRDFVFTIEGENDVEYVRVFFQGREVPPLGYTNTTVTVFFPYPGKYWVRLVINGKELQPKVITVK